MGERVVSLEPDRASRADTADAGEAEEPDPEREAKGPLGDMGWWGDRVAA
jgi:hypothetical protein